MTEWLTDEEMAGWRPFIESAVTLSATIDRELLASHDLNAMDYGILVVLSDSDDHRTRMSDLSGELGVEPSLMTYRVTRLVDRGVAERLPCADDGRCVLVRLTPAGHALLVGLAPAHVETVRREFLDHLTPTDLRDLARIFRKVRSHQLRGTVDSTGSRSGS